MVRPLVTSTLRPSKILKPSSINTPSAAEAMEPGEVGLSRISHLIEINTKAKTSQDFGLF